MKYDNPNHHRHYRYQLAVTRVAVTLITLTLFFGLYMPWLIDLRGPFFLKLFFAFTSFNIIYWCVFCALNLKATINKILYTLLLIMNNTIAYLIGD